MTIAKPKLNAPESILPSSLSTMRRVCDKLSVHLLRKEPEGVEASGVVLCCHGFGANATSYEDVMPLLSRDLASVVLCPDQVGFGLTERPELRLEPQSSFSVDFVESKAASLSAAQLYTLPGNAVLAGALLEEEINGDTQCNQAISTVVIGHSMGVSRLGFMQFMKVVKTFARRP